MTLTNEPLTAAPPDSLRTRTTRLLRGIPLAARVSIAVAIAVNLVVAGAYLWSRGGQETNVRIEVRGDDVTAWLDGKQIFRETLRSMPERGGVAVQIEPTEFIPSMPQPRGLNRLRVTDLDTGEVVYEDGFSSLDPSVVERGEAFVEDGHVRARNLVIIGPFGEGWRDIRVDATFDNIVGAGLMVRSSDPGNGALLSVRPFRHLDATLNVLQNGQLAEGAPGPRLEASQSEVMRSLVAMAVRGYPMVLLALVVVFAIASALVFAPIPASAREDVRSFVERLRSGRDWTALAPWFAVSVVAFSAVAVTAFINTAFNARLPHVPDEVSYIFQARVLASGHLSAAPPPVQESFEYFHPPFIAVSDGKWASIYPFGHPLMLAIGIKLGVMWLVPPVIGGAALLLLFGVAKQIYNVRVGLIAVLLMAASPFFLMTASNYMSHNTAVFYIVACLFCISRRDREPVVFPLIAGVFFGLLVNTRPLTATALVAPFGLMLLAWLVPPEDRLLALKSVASFVAGGASMLLAYGVYNLGTTGDMFLAGYSTGTDLNEVVGFGGAHSVSLGLQNEQTQMASLLLVFNGWRQILGIGLLLAPFVLGSRQRWDWTFLACAVAVMGIYTLYEAPGLMHGPRYWYEAMPFLVLLAARGAEALATAAASAASRARARVLGAETRADWAGVVVVYPVVAALAVFSAYDWLHGNGLGFAVDAIPRSASELRGFNGVNDRMVRAIEEKDPHNALVLVEACPNWQCMGSVFWKNAPSLDGDVVYAKNLPHRNGELFEQYPDRTVYEASYRQGAVWVYGAGGSPPPGEEEAEAPRAGEIPTPTPAPTATPDPNVALRQDERRRDDLEFIGQALEEYYGVYGGYPLAEGVQTLCAYSFDSGCALKEVADIPTDPNPQATYWYQSDGKSFVVYAAMEIAGDPAQCPDPIPSHLATIANLYCVRGGAPASAQ